MKAVIINKSDTVGGAAVVSRRLMHALRAEGIDARMLVVDKRTDSPYVEKAATDKKARAPFMAERLKIFLANGMNRETLFKVDAGSDGLKLHRHPLVKEADVVCLNWVNQGMLSLGEIREIAKMGKPIVWTMHDMWNFTGVCHHAGECGRWMTNCGLCPLLGKGGKPDDLSFKVWNNKRRVYEETLRHGNPVRFVAVSNWLADKAGKSPLLGGMPLRVIPNAFPVPENAEELRAEADAARGEGKFRVVMGAARLDDPVKGLPVLLEATRILRDSYPAAAENMELVTFGNFKNEGSMEGVGVKHTHLGTISGEENVREVYLGADAVVSTSMYETLPGTLVEGLVYGCVPVSFNRGGQRDIVDHLETGYIAEWSDDIKTGAGRIAEGLLWAMRESSAGLRARMLGSARKKFAAPEVARQYIKLFEELR